VSWLAGDRGNSQIVGWVRRDQGSELRIARASSIGIAGLEMNQLVSSCVFQSRRLINCTLTGLQPPECVGENVAGLIHGFESRWGHLKIRRRRLESYPECSQ
jgi:hypothetical protein